MSITTRPVATTEAAIALAELAGPSSSKDYQDKKNLTNDHPKKEITNLEFLKIPRKLINQHHTKPKSEPSTLPVLSTERNFHFQNQQINNNCLKQFGTPSITEDDSVAFEETIFGDVSTCVASTIPEIITATNTAHYNDYIGDASNGPIIRTMNFQNNSVVREDPRQEIKQDQQHSSIPPPPPPKFYLRDGKNEGGIVSSFNQHGNNSSNRNKGNNININSCNSNKPGYGVGILQPGVTIPPDMDANILLSSNRALILLNRLSVSLASAALVEFVDALRSKGDQVRNAQAYLVGVIKRYLWSTDGVDDEQKIMVKETIDGVIPQYRDSKNINQSVEGIVLNASSYNDVIPPGIPSLAKCTSGPPGSLLLSAVKASLDSLVKSEFCSSNDLNDNVITKLKMLSEKDALNSIKEISNCQRDKIRNFSSYFIGILNRYARGDILPHRRKHDRHEHDRQGKRSIRNRRSRSRSRSWSRSHSPRRRINSDSDESGYRRRHFRSDRFRRRSDDEKDNSSISSRSYRHRRYQEHRRSRSWSRDHQRIRSSRRSSRSPSRSPRSRSPHRRRGQHVLRDSKKNRHHDPSPVGSSLTVMGPSFTCIPPPPPPPRTISDGMGTDIVTPWPAAPVGIRSTVGVQIPTVPTVPVDILGIAERAASAVQAMGGPLPPPTVPSRHTPQDTRMHFHHPLGLNVSSGGCSFLRHDSGKHQYQYQHHPQYQFQHHQPQLQPQIQPQHQPHHKPHHQPQHQLQLQLKLQSQIQPQPQHESKSKPQPQYHHQHQNHYHSQEVTSQDLPQFVQLSIQNLKATGHLEPNRNLGDTVCRLLRELPENMALNQLERFSGCDASIMRSKEGYLVGILKKALDNIKGINSK